MNTKLNINLLASLDALLETANVSEAAQRVGVTQSAMSNALAQLRERFNDELLVRSKRQMILTPRAQQLRPELHRLINELRELVSETEVFDAKTSTRVFKIAMSEMSEFLLLPVVMEFLAERAPNIELRIGNVNHVTSAEPFLRNHMELAVGAWADENLPLVIEPCMYYRSVAVARKDHPLFAEELTLEKYLSAKHLRLQFHQEYGQTKTDEVLKILGHERDVAMTLPHIIAMLQVLTHSDYIGTLTSKIPPRAIEFFKLAVRPLPFDNELLNLKMIYLQHHKHDPGLKWLRDVFQEAADIVTHYSDL